MNRVCLFIWFSPKLRQHHLLPTASAASTNSNFQNHKIPVADEVFFRFRFYVDSQRSYKKVLTVVFLLLYMFIYIFFYYFICRIVIFINKMVFYYGPKTQSNYLFLWRGEAPSLHIKKESKLTQIFVSFKANSRQRTSGKVLTIEL